MEDDCKLRIAQMYESGKSGIEIAQLLDMSQSSVYYTLRGMKVKMRSNKVNSRRYDVDHDFFETIDSELKAYWLGFMYADGYITQKDYVGLSLNTKDEGHIYKFQSTIASQHPIHRYSSHTTYGYTEYSRLCFVSKKMCQDLSANGCVLSKTMILKPPKLDNEEHIRPFIRGYFDGDGCVTNGGKNCAKMTIVGNYELMKWVNSHLPDPGPLQQDKRKPYIYEVYNTNVKAINNLEWIYKDAKVFLDRKNKKALAFIKRFHGVG